MRARVIDDDEDDDIFDANGILKDGRTYRVPLRLCDSLQRSVAEHFAQPRLHDSEQPNHDLITDGSKSTLRLHRPGFRIQRDGNSEVKPVSDNVRDHRQRAYDEYGTELTNAWRNPPTGFGSREFRSAREGDLCTINGFPGHLKLIDGMLTCVPDKRSDARSPRDERASAYGDYAAWLRDAWRHP